MADRVMLAEQHIPKPPTPKELEYLATLEVDTTAGKIFREGVEVGCLDAHGYCKLWIGGRVAKRSHIVWWKKTGEWPTSIVDHEDKNRANDKIGNLRLATYSENALNKDGGYKGFKGLPKGVRLDGINSRNPYEVKLFRHKKTIFLGRYPTTEVASQAYIIGAQLFDTGEASTAEELRNLIKGELLCPQG